MRQSAQTGRSKWLDLLTERLAFVTDAPAAARLFLDLAVEASGASSGAIFFADPANGTLAACPASQGEAASRVPRAALERALRSGRIEKRAGRRGAPGWIVFPFTQGAVPLGCLLLLGSLKAGSRKQLVELASSFSTHLARTQAPLSANGVGETSRLVHDFRNIVAGISGYAQLLRRQAGALPPDQVGEYAEIIEREAERVARMAEAHLRALRGEASPERTESRLPAEIVGEVYALMAADLGQRGIHLLTRIESERRVAADPDLLLRALVNLLVNARQALPEGGIVELAVENGAEAVEFRVSDSGPGIPAAISEKLFREGVSHGKKNGNGLGLSIVKEAADLFGGCVRVEPSPFGGATVILAIPA